MIKSRIKTYAVDGKWTATIPVENLNDGIHDITAYIKDGENYSLSDTYEFQVKNERVELGEFRDEVGDDNGPNGKYIYPNHESFNREMDIKSVEFYSRGKNLEIVIEPANKISTYWKPKFGFDHVSYSIYIDTDGGSGTGILPYQRAKIKDDMMWNYMILAGGWSSFIYSSNGANEKSFGNPIAYAPQIKTDYKSNKISIVVPSKAIGEPEDLKKLKVYITTWDYDGLESSYRKIKEKPEHYIFGGGDENSPLIMDDTEIMDLRY